MKRVFIICFALAAVLLLSACGGTSESTSQQITEEPEQTEQEQTIPSNTAEASEQADENTQDTDQQQDSVTVEPIDPEKQLLTIIENTEEWLVNANEGNRMFAVTDLDDNGRLEIISSSMQGSGLYTYSNYYEVSDDGSMLEPCIYEPGDEVSQPDIMVMQTSCVRGADGILYYFFEDANRNSAAESYLTKYLLWLDHGVVNTKVLAIQHSVADGENVTANYYDTDHNTITKDDYNAAEEKIQGDRFDVELFWVIIPSQEEISEMVNQSWRGFTRNPSN